MTTTNETSPPAEVTAQEVLIRSMRPDEAGVVAGYHREGIPTGFLSELGAKFLTRYRPEIVADPMMGSGTIRDVIYWLNRTEGTRIER